MRKCDTLVTVAKIRNGMLRAAMDSSSADMAENAALSFLYPRGQQLTSHLYAGPA
jgi:hypothetical protein